MSTTRTFEAMLNEHLNYDLLREEMIKRVWLLENAEKDNSWLGGTLVVPFKGAQASSVSFGQLTASDEVHEGDYVRGTITEQPEVWGTLLFNQRDLWEHNKVSERNFLKLLPDALEDMLNYFKMVVSLAFLNGPFFARAVVNGTAGGVLQVDRVERFSINQRVQIDDDDTIPVTAFVRTINIQTSDVTFFDARSGGAATDLSAYTVAQNAKVFWDNSQGAPLTDLKGSLLSFANGGSEKLYNVVKLDWPYLQAIQVDGSSVTSTNILDNIFDGYTEIKNKGKGMPNKILMSYKNLGSVMKSLETTPFEKGRYHIDPKGTKVNVYGWTEISIFGVAGNLTVVGIQELDDDYIIYLDLRAIRIHSNGLFKRRISPDGDSYFELRTPNGYQYLVDIAFNEGRLCA